MSEPLHLFEFKPALLAKKRIFKIYSDRVEKWKGDELEDKILFTEIKSIRYANTLAREYRFRRLDLNRKGDCFRIAFNTTAVSDSINDPELKQFLDSCCALAGELENAGSKKRVSFGETSGMIKAMFAIGFLSMLFSVGAVITAIVTGVDTDKLLQGGIAFAVLFLFGLQICFSFNPWRGPVHLSLPDFIKVITPNSEKD